MNPNDSEYNFLINRLIDMGIHHIKGKDIFLKELKNCKNNEEIKHTVSNLMKAFFDDMTIIYLTSSGFLSLLKDFSLLLEKVPKREEFDDFRNALEDMNEKVVKTLKPIEDKINETLEKSKRSEGIYG